MLKPPDERMYDSVIHCDISNLEKALSDGADYRTRSGMLTLAASRGHIGIVRVLLKAGMNPNDLSRNGDAPIHGAAVAPVSGPEIVKMLVQSGADVNAQTRIGLTALDMAVIKKNRATVQTLLELNAQGEATSHVLAARLTQSGRMR